MTSLAARRLVVANWKMNVGAAAAREFLRALPGCLVDAGRAEIGIAPAAVHLASLATIVHAAGHRLFAQNCHQAGEGAHTGEISVRMLRELDVDGVILGHSERRQEFAESDDVVAEKLAAVLAADLHAIVCVGETHAEREEGLTAAVLGRQVESGLGPVGAAPLRAANLTVAYEPVWAIGSGRTATLQQVGEAIGLIRASLDAVFGRPGREVRILYGGSVTAENAAELLAVEGVGGALVGGASTDPGRFAAIAGA